MRNIKLVQTGTVDKGAVKFQAMKGKKRILTEEEPKGP